MLKPLVHQTYTPAADAVEAGKERVVRTAPNAVTVDMTLIRSAYTPDSFQVREGDQVTLKITNVETIRDMIHGFALPDHNLNIALAPGYTKTVTFDAGKPGVYWFYCTNFCSALHLEMRGRMVVQPKDSTVTLTDWHAAQNVKGQVVPACPRRETANESADDLRRRRGVRAAALVLPLWGFAMSAPQYPDETLHLQVQRTGIVGDVQEVSTLQHYIGVRFPTDLPELKWATRAIVAFAALLLLGAFVGAGTAGRVYRVLCAVALVTFLLASAAVVQARLYQVGHDRDPQSPLAGPPQFHSAPRRPGEGRQLHGVVVPARGRDDAARGGRALRRRKPKGGGVTRRTRSWPSSWSSSPRVRTHGRGPSAAPARTFLSSRRRSPPRRRET